MVAKHYVLLPALALGTGVLGGVVATRLAPRPAEAQPGAFITRGGITAGRFVLIDRTGAQRGTLEVTGDNTTRVVVTG